MYNVNIIMSVYNGEKYLSEQIDSIIASTSDNWKLYIFDDCSKDSSFSIASSYAEKYKHKIYAFKNRSNMGSTLSFLHNLNLVSKRIKSTDKKKIANGYIPKVRKPILAKIAGIKVIKTTAVNFVKKHKDHISGPVKCSQYYMFCDQDDSWLMDKIALTVSRIRKIERYRGKHKPALVFTDAILVDEKLKFVDKSFFKTNHMKAGKCDLGHILMENKAIGCTVAINQAAADILALTCPSADNKYRYRNEYDYIRYHDWWMALICASFGTVKYYHVPTVMYRQHGGNQVGQGNFSDYVKKRSQSKEDIKKRIDATIRQAECFYRCYGSFLKKRKLKVIKHFIMLKEYHPVIRRLIMFRYGFFKSGLLRNVALLMTI